jgi:hypothetical protein
MPPRWFSVIIVAFWLTTSAAFFWHEYWPYLEPGAPPPFAINLTDEAYNPIPVRWKVTRNGEPTYLTAVTNVRHDPKTNEFTLSAQFNHEAGKPQPAQSLLIDYLESEYRVNPEGQMLGLKATVSGAFQFSLDGKKIAKQVSGRAVLEGAVTNGKFTGTYVYDIMLDKDGDVYHKEGKLPPVAVSSQGSVLMPLHPVNHVRGLRPGQSWHMPLVNPLGDALLAALVPGSEPGTSTVFAKVQPQTRTLQSGKQETECFVIEYKSDDLNGRTWVRVSDGLVMQQEATLSGDTWILQRE